MGCNSCNKKNTSAEEQLLLRFELSLGFSNLDPLAIDRVLHRHSLNSRMSNSQMELSFTELKLNFSDHQNFYSRFLEDTLYNTRKLMCLGLLLSEEEVPKKLKILFHNYDSAMTGLLSREQFVSMLDDLTAVSCVIIPKGALKVNIGNSKLRIYVTGINKIRASVIKQLVEDVFEGKNTISEREFNLSYQREDGFRCVLSPKEIREYCYDLNFNLLGSVNKILSNLNGEDKDEIFNMLNGRHLPRRQSKLGKLKSSLND